MTGARVRAWARAWAGARVWAGARAGARSWAGAGAGAGARAHRTIDPVLLRELLDMAEENGEVMWECIKVGECILIEMPNRWYVGIVTKRTQLTAILSPAAMCHDLGDTGLFLEGTPKNHEVTPLPRPLEINLNNIDSAQPYPAEFFKKINKRSHNPE